MHQLVLVVHIIIKMESTLDNGVYGLKMDSSCGLKMDSSEKIETENLDTDDTWG